MGARSCDCSGGVCGPQNDEGLNEENAAANAGGGGSVSRRDFISLAGSGAAAAAGLISLQTRPVRASQTPPGPESAAQTLADWKKSLHEPDAPRRYTGGVHKDVRFPLGGIGTGNVELGADGQFISWQLFNTLRDGYVPFYWGVRAGKTAKLLQTAGGPIDWPRVQKSEMTGEYPIADLTFTDADLPVHVQLSAWTPLAPLDSAFSSWPVACFVWTVSNRTSEVQSVSVGAFLQNPVGYDAFGAKGVNAAASRWNNRHPNYGGNFNTLYHDTLYHDTLHHDALHHDKKAATLLMQADFAPPPPALARPLRLYTNVGVKSLNLFPIERPENLTVFPLDALHADAPAPKDEDVIVWIDAAPLDLSSTVLRPVRDLVDNGATLVWSGTVAPLLEAYGPHGAQKADEKTPALLPDVVFEDFENGYAQWSVEGTAFGTAPARGTLPRQQAVSGFAGSQLASSFANGDDATGKLTSKPFVVTHGYVRFLVGGGNRSQTMVRLVVDGKIVRTQRGQNNERLLPAVWDVRDFKNKTAQIEIVDEQTGAWGHISADHLVFSDLPVDPDLLPLLTDLMPSGVPAHLPDAQGGYAFTRHGRNKGGIVRVFGDLLPSDEAELWGARQKAYNVLCALVLIPSPAANGTPARAPGAGTMALSTNAPKTTALPTFTDWGAAWQWFTASGGSGAAENAAPASPSPRGETVNGALSAHFDLAPGETREVHFVLAWHYPNYYNAKNEVVGNHYATRWPDARTVAQAAIADFATLRERTENFRTTFYEATLPYWLKDCVSSQISTLRHAGVVFRSQNGDLYGWEGANGCCPPTCTHVWGYEQTGAYLFPDLERNMREIDLFRQQNANGGVNNRLVFPAPPHPTGEHPFADGHASTVLKAYREVRNSSGDALLALYWPRVRAAVDYLIAEDAASSPDKIPDGTLSGDQWNTYDNAIHGVNSFIGGYYLAALRAGEEMARRMNAPSDADRFHTVFEQGQKRLMELCWNGEYFHQHLPGYENRTGEYGPGCLSDQLIAQWWAHQLDLGYLFPPDMVKTALASVFRYNFLPDHTNFTHKWRKFAGGTDKGLLICTWPKSGRPAQTIPYVDEVWTGVEYQVAAHMLYEGMISEAFAIIKGARDRYDGVPRAPMPRNPWSEIECGGHYVRAMSSWSLLLALSGFSCDGPNARIRFTPRHTPDAFQSFFSGPEGWGSAKQTRSNDNKTQTNEITVVEGKLTLSRLHLSCVAPLNKASVTVAGKTIKATAEPQANGDVWVHFASKTTVRANQTLRVQFS